VAEALELADRAAAGVVGVAFGDDLGSLLAVKLAGAEHVPGGGEDLVRDRDDRLLVAAAAREPAVALAEIRALGATGGSGGLDQGGAQPWGAFAGRIELAGSACVGVSGWRR